MYIARKGREISPEGWQEKTAKERPQENWMLVMMLSGAYIFFGLFVILIGIDSHSTVAAVATIIAYVLDIPLFLYASHRFH